MASFNLNNLSVDSSGRASFSGIVSGIDFQATADAIIAARRIPAVTLENRILSNDARITALNDFRALLTTLKSSLANLRGAVSIDSSSDIFANKQVFASTSRSDGVAPAASGNLVGVTVNNATSAGTHTLEVRRIAAAHKISSSVFTSTTTALNIAGNITVGSGSATISVTVLSTDTLLDIRDRINNTNTGVTPTGVTASIVSVSSTESFLILTNDKTGANITVTDTGSVLSSLGLSTTNGLGNLRSGISSGNKVEVADGFSKILFDGTTGNSAYLVSYDDATKVLTLTRGDGETETVTLATDAIASGKTEDAAFAKFGLTITLDENFNKSVDITVAADTVSVTDGTGVIDAASIRIFDSQGDISAITSTTLTFGNFASPAALTVTAVGGFSGTLDASATGVKTLSLTDGKGNEILIQLNVTTLFNGSETVASIELHELENAITTNGSQFTSVLQQAQTARLTADGLVDKTHFESRTLTSQTAALTNFKTNATIPGSFDIVGSATSTISFTTSDTLQTLRDKINTVTGTTGVTARIIQDATGFRLEFNSSNAFSFVDTNQLLADLGVNESRVITRDTNTVGDLFTGVTINLFAAEAGTTIKLAIEQDLGALKTNVEGFVSAYNEVRRFINLQNKFDVTTGAKADDAGVLFGDSVMGAVQSKLAAIINGNVGGVDSAFSVLSQIGVDLVNNATVTSALDKETLVINNAKLDEALLKNPENVRRLLAFDFKSSNPNITLIGHTVKTSFSTTGYTLNVNFNDSLNGVEVVNGTVFTNVDAQTGGPASDGISAITFGATNVTGQAYRYEYRSANEELVIFNLTTGASQLLDITAQLDAATGAGEDLATGETILVNFAEPDITITLSGDAGSGFKRAVSIKDGTLVTAALTNTTMTGGAVTTPTSSMNKATVDALIAAGAYDQATGLLTLAIGSTGAGEAHFNTATGIKFSIDGGAVSADISAIDLDDGAAHTIRVFVYDGSSDIEVAALAFTTLTGETLEAGQNITLDLGTGLTAQSSVITSATVPMINYFPTLTDGNFDILDSNSVVIGNVAYTTGQSLTDVAATANGISGITVQVVSSFTGFQLRITSDTNDAITVASDTGNLISLHGVKDTGSTVFSANFGGAANGISNGSASIATNIITATNTTGAEGLKLLFSGIADVSAIQIDFTVGVAANLFFELDQILNLTDGSMQGQVAVLEGRNTLAQDKIDRIDRRLVIQRESLIRRFIAAELAISRTNNLISAIKSTFEALSNAQRN